MPDLLLDELELEPFDDDELLELEPLDALDPPDELEALADGEAELVEPDPDAAVEVAVLVEWVEAAMAWAPIDQPSAMMAAEPAPAKKAAPVRISNQTFQCGYDLRGLRYV